MKETVEMPEGYEADYKDGELTVSKDGDKVSRDMEHALIEVEIEDNEITFSSHLDNKTVKSIVGTFRAHVNNIVDGLEEEHVYKMKGVYAHFPMDIKVEGNQLVIENFMGERNPRKIAIEEGVDVNVDGEDLEITGSDKEAVGLTAGRIEQACKKGNRDPRTFQDGIYITEKGGER